MGSGKTLVILATASLDNELELNVNGQLDVCHLPYRGLPKALFPISGRPVLSYTYSYMASKYFDNVIIVTNAHNYKHFERWASGNDFPRHCILNAGFSHCYLEDLCILQRVKQCADGVVVMLPNILVDSDRSRDELLNAFASSEADTIVKDDKGTLQPLAFCMSKETLDSLETRLKDQPECHHEKDPSDAPTHYKNCLESFFANRLSASSTSVRHDPAYEFMSTDLSFQDYLTKWIRYCDHTLLEIHNDTNRHTKPTHVKTYARVGLMGNPSDGFYGKTISLLISNFWAEAILIPNIPGKGEYSSVSILPNPVADPHHFSTFQSLATQCEREGYSHGDRLLLACCKVFFNHCQSKGIKIDTRQGFQVIFETNVPRQVGLAGSSAIITAVWKALLQFYRLTSENIPLAEQASLILSVEQDELGIAAGLQDRVIQTYGGLVYMDFDKEHMEKYGYGRYEQLDITSLPPLWLAYVADPEDSGKVHSTVKQRFHAGDPQVVEAMRGFAELAQRARSALEKRDHRELAQLMTANIELRRKTYNDAVVGKTNLKMVEIARSNQCVAKLSGSGGAVVGMWCGEDEQTRKKDLSNLRKDLEKDGFVFVDLVPMNTVQES